MITFHAKPSKEEKHPTHTLCFEQDGDKLLCTFSRPHPGLESYCKVTGNNVSSGRMSVLKSKVSSLQNLGKPKSLKKELQRMAPSCVRKSLKYYVGNAIRYFKMEKNPTVVLRGIYADWEQYMKNRMDNKVPVKATVSTFKLEEL